MKDAVDLICAELKRLELPTSLASSTELRMIIYDEAQEQADSRVSSGKSMRFEPLTFARYNKYAEYLVTRLKDELSTKTVMTFPLNKVGYFDGSKDTFPVNVRDNFPSADHDMDEACKCFALGRYTASVFHQMRIMEVGLNTLGGALGLPVASNWGRAIEDIEREIKSRSVRNAWSTMED